MSYKMHSDPADSKFPMGLKNSAKIGLDPISKETRPLLPGEALGERGEIILLDGQQAKLAFDQISKVTPSQVKQSFRRSEAIKHLTSTLSNRVEPGNINVAYITLNEFRRLQNEYAEAKEEGLQDEDLDFLPLSSYIDKIAPQGKPAIRPVLENEYGVFQMASNPTSPLAGKIVCIRGGEI